MPRHEKCQIRLVIYATTRIEALLPSNGFLANLRPAVARVYIVSFRTHDDRTPSKFIVLADDMRAAINMAWEHGGADFQSRFDKSSAQAVEMTRGALRVL
jgi:hypothetical protein